MRTHVALGRLASVDVRLAPSGLAAFVLLCTSVVLVSNSVHPEWPALGRFAFTVLAIALVVIMIAVREALHAIAARSLGTRVNRITLLAWGGSAELERDPRSPAADALLALVGPAFHLGAGVVLGGFARVAIERDPLARIAIEHQALTRALPRLAEIIGAHTGVPWVLAAWLAAANVAFGLFQLVPAFPLEGGRLLRALLWNRSHDRDHATDLAVTVALPLAVLLIVVGIYVIFRAPFSRAGGVQRLDMLAGAWVVMMGYFILVSGTPLALRRKLRRRPT